MDWIGDILVGIFEFFIRLLYGVIRVFVRAIGFVLSHTWLAAHFGVLRTMGVWIAAISGLYLVFGVARAMVPALWTPALTPIYQWQFVAIAMLVMLFGIAMRELDVAHYVPDDTRHKFEPDRTVAPKPADTGPIQTTPTIHSSGIVAAIVFVVLVVGIISAVSSERHEATLAEKLCAQANAHISDGAQQTVRDGAGLFDRVFGTQTADRIPCGDD